MPATVSTVPVYAGDNLYLQYNFLDALPPAGVGVDLSAWTFTAQWRTTRNSESYIDFTVDESNKATGVIVLTMTGLQTESMSCNGFFDLNGVDGSEVRTFLQGTTSWTQDVTRG